MCRILLLSIKDSSVDILNILGAPGVTLSVRTTSTRFFSMCDDWESASKMISFSCDAFTISSISDVHLDLYETLLCRLLEPPSNIELKSDFTEPSRLQPFRIAGLYCPDAHLFKSVIDSFLKVKNMFQNHEPGPYQVAALQATPGLGKSTFLDAWSRNVWKWQHEQAPEDNISTNDLHADEVPWLKHALILPVSFALGLECDISLCS